MDYEEKLESGYYAGKDLVYPKVPEKNPAIQKAMDSKESSKIKAILPALKEYEDAMERYKEDKANYRILVRERCREFEADVASHYGLDGLGLSEKTLCGVFNKAWEDGHSSGFSDVDLHYAELASLIKEVTDDLKNENTTSLKK